jgi:hypothetical protein
VQNSLVTIQTFDNSLEAHLIKSQLESVGIPAMLKDENLVGLNPLFNITVGGIKLQVNPINETEALNFLTDLRRSEHDKVACPKCGNSDCYIGYKSTKNRKGILAIIISLLTFTYPLYYSTVNKCKACDHEFRD